MPNQLSERRSPGKGRDIGQLPHPLLGGHRERGELAFLDRLEDDRSLSITGATLAQRHSVPIAEIGEMRLALPDRTFGLRRLVDDMVAASGIALKPAQVTSSIQSLRSFARAGLGISALTRCAPRRDVAEGRLITVPLQGRNLRKACQKICLRNGRTLSPAARALARHLARSARTYAAGHA